MRGAPVVVIATLLVAGCVEPAPKADQPSDPVPLEASLPILVGNDCRNGIIDFYADYEFAKGLENQSFPFYRYVGDRVRFRVESWECASFGKGSIVATDSSMVLISGLVIAPAEVAEEYARDFLVLQAFFGDPVVAAFLKATGGPLVAGTVSTMAGPIIDEVAILAEDGTNYVGDYAPSQTPGVTPASAHLHFRDAYLSTDLSVVLSLVGAGNIRFNGGLLSDHLPPLLDATVAIRDVSHVQFDLMPLA